MCACSRNNKQYARTVHYHIHTRTHFFTHTHTQAFGCQPQQQSAEDIVSSLQHALQSTQQHSTADAQTPQRVFAVCAPVAPATAASAQSELQLLESVQQALDQHVCLY